LNQQKEIIMKQYSVYFDGQFIEATGYFKSVSAVRAFLKKRYSNTKGMTFQAVYPALEQTVYEV
jgi:hypothetical protein